MSSELRDTLKERLDENYTTFMESLQKKTVAKRHIIAQFLVETTAILLLTFLFSRPVSYFTAMQIGTFLRDMIGAVSIDLPAWKLLLQYGIEAFAVIIGVMIAAYPIFQLHPKEILSKMS